jgi:hypothetical protein
MGEGDLSGPPPPPELATVDGSAMGNTGIGGVNVEAMGGADAGDVGC